MIINYPLEFGAIPNDGIGRTARSRTKGQGRRELLEARNLRHREASPGHQLSKLPRLISEEDLAVLRHDVPPVSLAHSLSALSFTDYFRTQSIRPCRSCFLAGRTCHWVSWNSKCDECCKNHQGRCSFQESPEERMDNSEAAHSWGRDSLSCKSNLRSLLFSDLFY